MNKIIGKNKRRQLEGYDSIHNLNLSVDSIEELDFLNWLCEAHNLSIINDFEYQPDKFTLFDSIKYTNVFKKENTLFQEHSYSPDFKVVFDPKKNLDLSKEFHIPYFDLSSNLLSILIDVKGTFSRNDGGRSFSINQKWMYQKFKIYIYKLIPKIFFKKFGVPQASLITNKTKKPKKIFQGFSLMKDIFNKIK